MEDRTNCVYGIELLNTNPRSTTDVTYLKVRWFRNWIVVTLLVLGQERIWVWLRQIWVGRSEQ